MGHEQHFARHPFLSPPRTGPGPSSHRKNVKTWTWTTGGYASFDLGASNAWTGGGASCVADSLNATYQGGHQVDQTLASVTFPVGG